MIENKQVNVAASDKRDCVKPVIYWEGTRIPMSEQSRAAIIALKAADYAGDQGDENDANKLGRRIVKLCSVCGGPAHYANSLTWQRSTTGCPAYHATTPTQPPTRPSDAL